MTDDEKKLESIFGPDRSAGSLTDSEKEWLERFNTAAAYAEAHPNDAAAQEACFLLMDELNNGEE